MDEKMEKILVILDGAADLPTPALDKKTPLEFAKTPNLDELTQKGKLGLLYPIDEKTVPGSDTSLISLFGNNSEECKRGIYEAVGAGLKIQKGDLVLRTNFATMKDPESREILDRRAGRTLTTKEAKILAKAINKEVKLPFPFEFKPTVQHRGVLVIRGKFSEE
jgi:2,3-bisphosphoglycerate-independent phosphoglycerate mutase